MPDNSSQRHQLPYLVVAQAQKEITHNEALARIDALLHPVVAVRLATLPSPLLADAGKCWLVDVGGTGGWENKANQIAVWVGGSWRYLTPVDGMRVRNVATSSDLVWTGIQWKAPPVVAAPQSGEVIDVEARTVIEALLVHFRAIGLLAP